MDSLPFIADPAQGYSRPLGQVEFHSLANAFPLIEGDEFAALVADITANGLRDKITLYEGKILDGRNRYRAAQAAGVELTQNDVRFFVGDDPLGFVVSVNLRRRHLDASQRATIAAKLANMPLGGAVYRSANLRTDLEPSANLRKVSHADAAKMINVSTRSVESAAALLKSGDAELVAAVEKGEVTVSAAAETVRRAEPAPARQPEPFQPGPVMLRMRNDAASLKGADLATLIAEWVNRIEVAVAVGSRADVMAQLGGVEAARSSISAWVRGDVLDSQRIGLARETIAAIKSDVERNK